MSKAFLDSSALIDLVFRSRDLRSRVLALVPRDTSLVTSRYVLYEKNARHFDPICRWLGLKLLSYS